MHKIQYTNHSSQQQTLKLYTGHIIGEYQAGFKAGKSTMDQIFAVKSVLEKAWECNVDTRHISIDFQSDYDNKQRDKLYEIMNFFWKFQIN